MATKSTKKKAAKSKKVLKPKKETTLSVSNTTVMKLSSLREKLNFSKLYSQKRLFILIGLVVLVVLVVLASKYIVVAWVDKKPVTVFEYYSELDKKYGKDVKEQIIVERLVNSEASNRGINISGQDLENEIKRIETEQGGADKLNQILEIQGISQNEFKKLVRLQLIKQKMFEGNISISEDDVKKYIDDNKVTEVDDKMREQIKTQLKMQKINTEFNNWLKGALQSSRVMRV